MSDQPYATVAQFRATVGSYLTDLDLPGTGDDQAIADLLMRASADIDQFLHWPPPSATDDPLPGARIPRSQLNAWETWSLGKACVEQALYRLVIGEQELIEGAPQMVSIQGISFSQRGPDLIGAEAAVSLAGMTMLWQYRTGLGVPDPPPTDASTAAA
jgi:hypothetical protein